MFFKKKYIYILFFKKKNKKLVVLYILSHLLDFIYRIFTRRQVNIKKIILILILINYPLVIYIITTKY